MGWKQGNTPEKRFGTPAFGGGFFCSGVRAWGFWDPAVVLKEEGRPSRWKDGLPRSFVHCNRPVQ